MRPARRFGLAECGDVPDFRYLVNQLDRDGDIFDDNLLKMTVLGAVTSF